MTDGNNHDVTDQSLPTVTAGVIESAVSLAKAELRLTVFETRALLVRLAGALAWVILAGCALQIALAALVLVPLVSLDIPTAAKWWCALLPLLLALGLCGVAVVRLQKVKH